MHHTHIIILITLLTFSFDAIAASNMADTGLYKSTKDLKKRIKNGEDVNFQDNDGTTALMNAVYGGYVKSVKILLDAGADVNLKNSDGDTTIGNVAFRRTSADAEILDLLLANGADIDAKGSNGSTPLSYAVAFGHKSIVEALLARGVDVEVEDDYGQTAIWEVCSPRKNNIEILDMLLAKGADINSLDVDGDTLSAMSSCENKTELLTYMQSKGLE